MKEEVKDIRNYDPFKVEEKNDGYNFNWHTFGVTASSDSLTQAILQETLRNMEVERTNRQFTIHTGLEGMRQFNRALREQSNNLSNSNFNITQ